MSAPHVVRPLIGGVIAVVLAAAVASGTHAQSPAPFDVVEASIPQLQQAMKDGRVTSRQIVEAYLARIRKYDQSGPALNAFITLNPRALDTADALDQERREKGPRGILHGIPIVVKDN